MLDKTKIIYKYKFTNLTLFHNKITNCYLPIHHLSFVFKWFSEYTKGYLSTSWDHHFCETFLIFSHFAGWSWLFSYFSYTLPYSASVYHSWTSKQDSWVKALNLYKHSLYDYLRIGTTKQMTKQSGSTNNVLRVWTKYVFLVNCVM